MVCTFLLSVFVLSAKEKRGVFLHAKVKKRGKFISNETEGHDEGQNKNVRSMKMTYQSKARGLKIIGWRVIIGEK
jgi:hypothetical protein